MSDSDTKVGEVIDAEYLPDKNVVEYTFKTVDGEVGTAKLSERPWGPDTKLPPDAMRQMAEQLPGTPLYDRTDGGLWDPETVPSIGWSV